MKAHDPPTLHAEVQLEQFRILCRQVPLLYAVLTINTCVLCYSVYGSVPIYQSVGVPIIFLVLVTIRFVIWCARRNATPTPAQIQRYLFNTTAVAAVVSLGLGIWGVALLHSDVSDEPFVPMFIAFGSIACAYCLVSLPRAAFATIVLATGPVLLTLLFSASPVQTASGVNLLLIFGLILRIISHQSKYLVEMVETHSQVRTLAYTDTLTGLHNRRALLRELQAKSAGTPASTSPILMAIIDLDGFKSINDTYGHPGGDEVLIQAAKRISIASGEDAFVARLGGDEFAVLSTRDCAAGSDIAFGTRLLKALDDPFTVAETTVHLSASIGIAVYPADAADPMDLLTQADLAMYEVKRDSPNGVTRFTPDMDKRLRRRVKIEQALRQTRPLAAIRVVYQPVFDVSGGPVRSFEALARWDHPELGAVSPPEFIEAAERAGIICELSERIFAIAIEQAAQWPSEVGLSINLSGIQLSNPTTPPMIMSLLDRYGMDPARLEVEVTETSLLADFTVACEQLAMLRSTGIRIVLDDFGSGYASIAYLKKIPFDRVKIDGDLVTDIVGSSDARRLLDGVLRLCKAIGVPATAEKIENSQQLAILTLFGCDRVQGYLLGKPGDADVARAIISSESAIIKAA